MAEFHPRPTRRARELRNTATPAERKLWTHISRSQVSGVKFSRQIAVGPFICDFVGRSHGLVIELDRGQHDQNEGRDRDRTAYIESMGFRVLRFWNDEMLEHIEHVLSRVSSNLMKFHPGPLPLAGGV